MHPLCKPPRLASLKLVPSKHVHFNYSANPLYQSDYQHTHPIVPITSLPRRNSQTWQSATNTPSSSPPTTNAATSQSSSGSSSKPSKPSTFHPVLSSPLPQNQTNTNLPATSTGKSSSSTTAPPTARSKSPNNSSPPSARTTSNCTRAQANSA